MSKSKNGFLWKSLSVVVTALTAIVLCVTFTVRADSKAQAAIERTADQEVRLRKVEWATIEIAGDIKAIRATLEAFAKRDKP
ncbi:MAG TPA: hypothetical protein VNA25_23200 [Phycisphaerae bacterium]|nr:hypothetical protein [Phycisphaerae bacterium]